MIKNKKADLSLSINAIVILILAITMLGLGLTFMRGLFKEATGKVESAVNVQQLANPPTSDNPLTVSPAALTIRSTKSDKLLVAFLSPRDGVCQMYVVIRGDTMPVTSGVGGGSVELIFSSALAKNMKIDQISTWTVAVKGVAEGTKLFTLKMDCGASAVGTNLVDTEVTHKFTKDIVITVKS